MKLILASASPRRMEILRNAGIAFEIRPSDVDEAPLPGESAMELVSRLAETKARSAAAQMNDSIDDCLVIGADTTVELDGRIFGKPGDAAHARAILTALRGRTHRVLTGLFLLHTRDGAARAAVEITLVTFAALSDEEIEAYIASGEPFDKAGGYAIQGRAGRFIPKIEGCYFNVVGLPLSRFCKLLEESGWEFGSVTSAGFGQK